MFIAYVINYRLIGENAFFVLCRKEEIHLCSSLSSVKNGQRVGLGCLVKIHFKSDVHLALPGWGAAVEMSHKS